MKATQRKEVWSLSECVIFSSLSVPTVPLDHPLKGYFSLTLRVLLVRIGGQSGVRIRHDFSTYLDEDSLDVIGGQPARPRQELHTDTATNCHMTWQRG